MYFFILFCEQFIFGRVWKYVVFEVRFWKMNLWVQSSLYSIQHWWCVLNPSLGIFLNNSFFAVVMLVKDLCFASLSLKTYANFSNSLVKTKTYFALTRAEKTKSGFCSGAIKGRKKHFREKAHHCCVFKKSFGIIFFFIIKKRLIGGRKPVWFWWKWKLASTPTKKSKVAKYKKFFPH